MTMALGIARVSRLALVAGMAVGLAGTAAQGGNNPVTNVTVVFVPPIIFGSGVMSATPAAPGSPRRPAGSAGGAGAAAAASGAGGAVAAADAGTVAAATEQQEGGASAGARVAAQITQVVELCRGLPNQAYAVDCVAAGLADVASAMQRDKEQAAAKAALEKAARDLRALAQENRDPALPRVTARRGEVATSRPVVAVVPSPAVAAAADAIVAEAQTVLLRSAPADTAPEYNRISAALDTSRVLLRSS